MNKYFKFAVVLVSAVILAFVFASALVVGLIALIAIPIISYLKKREIILKPSAQKPNNDKVLEAEFSRVEVKD